MIKGIARHIICDRCGKIITRMEYKTVVGKKRKLHYCYPRCFKSKFRALVANVDLI